MIQERRHNGLHGLMMVIVLLLAIAGEVAYIISHVGPKGRGIGIPIAFLAFVASLLAFKGLFVVNPNEAQVLQLFGDYRGTVRKPGLRWANPFYTKRKVSLRVRNFETTKLKVNDKRGNPIEIGAVITWSVVDSAQAIFEVDNYESFVHVQSEAALRGLASGYPYDAHGHGEVDLVSHIAEVSGKLKVEVQERLAQAGVEVLEARISHLAYAQEIAAAMLQRQQASAVVAARQTIVEGAVGMVEMALVRLAEKNVVDLDSERKAAMVANLLVVLCGDRAAQPVLNTGTLHH